MFHVVEKGMHVVVVLLALGVIAAGGCSRAKDVPPPPKSVESATAADATSSQRPKQTEPTPGVATNGVANAEKSQSSEPTTPASPEGAKAVKAKREPIYEEQANGQDLIAAALERAKANHKRVLIEWGGNWCGWCIKLHNVFKKDEIVKPIVYENYELVLIDQGPNHELMESYGGKDTQFSYPHLTILDVDGSVLTNQETSSLEIGPKHDPEKVSGFLKKWAPPPQDAEAELASALKRATDENKRVLVHVGTPYCGWCVVLSAFLHEQEALFSRDYVDLKIDTLRMTNGEDVAKRLHPGGDGGIPWTLILDAKGTVLATSFGPEGNIGYPYKPEEIDHFLTMLKSTKQQLTDTDLQTIRSALESYREKRESRLKEKTAQRTVGDSTASR